VFAVVESDSTDAECCYSSADKNSTEVVSVCHGSETVSTNFVSRSELTPSWKRVDGSSGCANDLYSMASSASSIEVITDDQCCDSYISPVSDYTAVDSIKNFDCRQTWHSQFSVSGTNPLPVNLLDGAEETDNSVIMKQAGDRVEQTAAEAFDDRLSRTVEILNVQEDLLDEIELYVEHRKHGGGQFETFEYDGEHQRLTVVFVDAKGQRNTSSCFCRFYDH